MDEVIAINRRNHARYRRALAGIGDVRLLEYDERQRSNRQFVVIEIDAAAAGVARDGLVDVLRAENVLASQWVFNAGV